MESLGILICDDHPLFRKGIRSLLESIPDIQVVGEASTGDDAVALAAALQPDVILMDLQMPDGGGISATRRILQANPGTCILILTLYEDEDSVFAALRAGARGYILKDSEEEDIQRAIRAVSRGEAIFSPSIATRLLDFFASNRPSVAKEAFPTLTEREREILHLIAQGEPNSEIARQLSLSSKTVANYVSAIFTKLQVADRAQAIVRARDAGIGA